MTIRRKVKVIRRALSKLRGISAASAKETRFDEARIIGIKEGEMVMKKTEAKKSNKRTLSRKELFDLIEKEAYNFFINRGYTHGDDLADWFRAERIVKEKLNIK